MRKLQEKIKYLEENQKSEKLEQSSRLTHLESTIQQIEKEKNEAIVQAKLAEERHKHLVQERERHDKQVESKHRARLSQTEMEVDRLTLALQHGKDDAHRQEEDGLRKQVELEKLHALVQQKLDLTETQLTEAKKRLSAKELEAREQNSELSKARKEIITANNLLNSLKSKHEMETAKLQKRNDEQLLQAQGKLNTAEQVKESSATTTRQHQLNSERALKEQQKFYEQKQEHMERQFRQFMETQQNFMRDYQPGQASSASNEQELNQKLEKYKQQKRDANAMNYNLQNQILQMQQKQQGLEKTIASLKKDKQLVQQAFGFQCKVCSKLIKKEEFADHVNECNRNLERMSIVNLMPIKIRILNCYVLNENKEATTGNVSILSGSSSATGSPAPISSDYQLHPSQVVYEIEINNRGTTWRTTKTLEELKEFFGLIEASHLGTNHTILSESMLDDPSYLKKCFKTEIATIIVENLSEYACMPHVREHPTFRQFFEIESNNVSADSSFDQMINMQQSHGGGFINAFNPNSGIYPASASTCKESGQQRMSLTNALLPKQRVPHSRNSYSGLNADNSTSSIGSGKQPSHFAFSSNTSQQPQTSNQRGPAAVSDQLQQLIAEEDEYDEEIKYNNGSEENLRRQGVSIETGQDSSKPCRTSNLVSEDIEQSPEVGIRKQKSALMITPVSKQDLSNPEQPKSLPGKDRYNISVHSSGQEIQAPRLQDEENDQDNPAQGEAVIIMQPHNFVRDGGSGAPQINQQKGLNRRQGEAMGQMVGFSDDEDEPEDYEEEEDDEDDDFELMFPNRKQPDQVQNLFKQPFGQQEAKDNIAVPSINKAESHRRTKSSLSAQHRYAEGQGEEGEDLCEPGSAEEECSPDALDM